MIRTALTSRSGSFNKVYTFLKGPGWEPGKPRMGNIEDIPDVSACTHNNSNLISFNGGQLLACVN